jgi:type I restriction-modification system DNA methylase subunit
LQASLASFKATVEKLIGRFEADKSYYLSKGYSEAQARVDFITPFFKALGWDVENEEGLPHHNREVVVEAGEDTRGRPDYGFRVSGQTKFFVEAKAPSEELDTAKHIIQAKTYAWNTKQVFFVVLTDFEEFRFYDASIQPDARKPDEGLLLKLKYSDYVPRLEKLWEFSKELVLAGSLEAMMPRDRRTQRLRIPVDTAFLDEMTGWREDVAKNAHKNNPDLTARQLNEIVQRLLDRIVFIRIAEDRHVIEKNQLRDVVDEWKARGGKFHIFEWLNDLFRRINEDFNGEIFKPHLSEKTKMDSEILARIIERLYPPQSPYRFDVIGVELLGSIYERYLGSTIRVTAKRVFVEEKPEVRKAGGVYYTPEYVANYIVQNTVGKMIEGKTPRQIEKLHILDPACGSGSFLIGAFQCLIDYHVRYLTEHPKEAEVHPLFPDVVKGENGEPRLSVIRKAKILKNNLFGVDIDPQAVEITMMSLYLKALEGERSQLPPKQHLLPELKYNIACGNSLIGPDFYKTQQLLFVDDDDKFRVNAFDWDVAFPDVLKAGGFDAVIGNPPYVRQESLSEFKEYFERHYESFDSGADLYVYFMEKGIRVLAQGGYYSIIVSSSFLRTTYANELRDFLKKSAAILRIVDFGGLAVFENAKDTYVCIPLLSRKKQPNRIEIARVTSLDFENLAAYVAPKTYTIPSQRLTTEAWSLRSDQEAAIFQKILAAGTPLGRYVDKKMFYGVKTGLNEAFELTASQARYIQKKIPSSGHLVKNVLGGEDIRKYFVTPQGKLWIVIPAGWTRDMMRKQKVHGVISEREAWAWFSRRYKALAEHLHAFESRCRKREDQGEFWWELRPCDYYEYFERPKIIFPDIAKGPRFHLDAEGFYLANTGYCLGTADKYLLGILNSRLFWFAISNISIPFGIRAGEYRYRLIYQYMEKVPIRVIDAGIATDKALHENLVSQVERMLGLQVCKRSGRLAPSELEHLEREIIATDAEIDDLVCRLYGITAVERQVIEGSLQ